MTDMRVIPTARQTDTSVCIRKVPSDFKHRGDLIALVRKKRRSLGDDFAGLFARSEQEWYDLRGLMNKYGNVMLRSWRKSSLATKQSLMDEALTYFSPHRRPFFEQLSRGYSHFARWKNAEQLESYESVQMLP